MNKNKLHALLALATALTSLPGIAHAVPDAPATGNPFTIGSLFSLSGYGQIAGQAESNGVQLAVEEINVAGGISHRKLESITEDSRSDLKATAEAMHKLVGVDKVPVVIGPNWAEFAEVAAGIAEREKAVMMTPSGYTKTLTDNRTYVFSGLENHDAIVKSLSDLIVSRHPKKIAFILDENAYFQSIGDALTSQLGKASLKIWKTFLFNPADTDFKSAITKLNADAVDAVVLLTLENGSTYDFLKQAKQLKLAAPVYAANSIPYDQALMKDPSVANGVIFFDYSVSITPEFKQKYTARFHAAPEFDAGRSYDLVYFVKAAAEQCGMSSAQIRDCLTRSVYHGVSGDLSFDVTRNLKIVQQPSKLWTVTDGKIVPFE